MTATLRIEDKGHNRKMLIRSKGGSNQRKVYIDEIQVPDMWHIAYSQPDPAAREAVLECWHLCHDLLKHIRGE